MNIQQTILLTTNCSSRTSSGWWPKQSRILPKLISIVYQLQTLTISSNKSIRKCKKQASNQIQTPLTHNTCSINQIPTISIQTLYRRQQMNLKSTHKMSRECCQMKLAKKIWSNFCNRNKQPSILVNSNPVISFKMLMDLTLKTKMILLRSLDTNSSDFYLY